MSETITLIATASFGLESVVKYEVAELGFDITHVAPGRVEFVAAPADIPRANLWLRCAERVLLKMGAFTAVTFDELFEQTKALPWAEVITQDGRFTVNATAAKSELLSDRSCQAIVKKAVVEALQDTYNVAWFPETGAEFTIEVSIFKDEALLAIDTSGAGLHKRGYRLEGGVAPLQETLAAGLVMLSFWQRERRLIDPMCGAGTILIEAAMLGRNMAPGLNRSFAAEGWPLVAEADWQTARDAARQVALPAGDMDITGYDVDADAIAMAKRNAARAGVADDIVFQQKDVHDLWIDRQYGIVISNPPYGRRLADYQALNDIYISLHKTFRKKTGWSVFILTADKKFPNYFKRARPNRVRRLVNGPISVTYYQYHGEKPPRLA